MENKTDNNMNVLTQDRKNLNIRRPDSQQPEYYKRINNMNIMTE